jgi:hypothetical protein
MMEWFVGSADPHVYSPFIKSIWSTLLVRLCLGVASFFSVVVVSVPERGFDVGSFLV